MSEITKKNLKHLADLARLELDAKEEDKFLKDLTKILDHFKELQGIDTLGIEPMAGGTPWLDRPLKNVLREDEERLKGVIDRERETANIIESMPEKERGYLRIPPVFE